MEIMEFICLSFAMTDCLGFDSLGDDEIYLENFELKANLRTYSAISEATRQQPFIAKHCMIQVTSCLSRSLGYGNYQFGYGDSVV